MITVADELDKKNPVKELSFGSCWRTIVEQGFVYLDGKLREVRDVHQTSQGVQIELYPHIIPCVGISNRYEQARTYLRD